MTDTPLASHGTPTGFLDDDDKGSPFKKEFPFMFDQRMIPHWDAEVDRLQDFLRHNGIHEAWVDEVAILCPDANMAGTYVFDAVLVDGVEHFNASEDLVKVEPFGNEYRVRYDFLRIADRPYRLEVMHMTDGISPLHAPLYQQAWTNNVPTTVHLSFKCPSEAAYRMACGLLRDQMAMVVAQSCESSYGSFSYWRTDVTDLYVKPRFNRRDS